MNRLNVAHNIVQLLRDQVGFDDESAEERARIQHLLEFCQKGNT